MNILAIGNSFSQDATAYLHQMAKACGMDAQVTNLYVPGCSLESHWKFVQNGDEPAYDLEENGAKTGRKISLRAALGLRRWDVITLQQCSPLCGVRSSYTPYLPLLCGFCRALSPGSRFYLHETWAYELDSAHGAFPTYHNDQGEMHRRLRAANRFLGKALSLPLIPCGDVIQALRQTPAFDRAGGGEPLTRDGYHMSLHYGRLALAATWCETLLGLDVRGCDFVPDDPNAPETTAEKRALVRQAAHRIAGRALNSGA